MTNLYDICNLQRRDVTAIYRKKIKGKENQIPQLQSISRSSENELNDRETTQRVSEFFQRLKYDFHRS